MDSYERLALRAERLQKAIKVTEELEIREILIAEYREIMNTEVITTLYADDTDIYEDGIGKLALHYDDLLESAYDKNMQVTNLTYDAIIL